MRRIANKEIPLVKSRILERRQDFKCAICPEPVSVLTGCLDHDHVTGRIRGVLCRNCNGIEGKIRNLVTRGRRTLSHVEYINSMQLYWSLHSVDRTGLLHPLHKTDDEKRIKRNAKARKIRAAKKATKTK